MMDYDFTPEQESLIEACRVLCERHAGVARARELEEAGAVDRELLGALAEAGFLDLARDPQAGPLEACLVTEEVARALGSAPVGARTLVAPALLPQTPPPVVALARAGTSAPVRYGAQADLVLGLDGDDAFVAEVRDFEAVRTNAGCPFARLVIDRGESLGAGSGRLLRSWWQVAIAAEVAGAATAALDLTLEHARERRQFGRPIGANQALQHRLADVFVSIEGTRWLARDAAFHGADPDRAAAAAVHAVRTARQVYNETHQIQGAIGFTDEYDLHLWTLRLRALAVEAGGSVQHSRDLVQSRWEMACP